MKQQTVKAVSPEVIQGEKIFKLCVQRVNEAQTVGYKEDFLHLAVSNDDYKALQAYVDSTYPDDPEGVGYLLADRNDLLIPGGWVIDEEGQAVWEEAGDIDVIHVHDPAFAEKVKIVMGQHAETTDPRTLGQDQRGSEEETWSRPLEPVRRAGAGEDDDAPVH